MIIRIYWIMRQSRVLLGEKRTMEIWLSAISWKLNKIYFVISIDFNKIDVILNFVKVDVKGGLKWR